MPCKSTQKHRIALVGAGRMALVYGQLIQDSECEIIDGHISGARRPSDLYSVVGVVDANINASKRLAHYLGCECYSTSLEDLDTKGKLEAILITTPTVSHIPLATEALEEGLFVLCEKPLAHSVAQAAPLVDLERKAGVSSRFFIAHNRCHNPAVRVAKQYIESQRAKGNRMRYAEASFYHRYHPYSPTMRAFGGAGWRGRPELSGGGIIIESVIHQLYTLEYLLGDITHVHASGRALGPPTLGQRVPDEPDTPVEHEEEAEHSAEELEDAVAIAVQFRSGAVGSVSGLWGAPVAGDGIRLFGDPWFVRIGSLEWRSPGEPALEIYDGASWHQPCAGTSWRGTIERELLTFADVIEDRAVPVENSLRAGLHAVAVVEASYRSMSTGRREEVQFDFEGLFGN